MKATTLLKQDHAQVLRLFARLGRTDRTRVARRRALVDELVTTLDVHAKTEEELFDPVIAPLAPRAVEEGEDEHAEIRSLIAEVQGCAVDSPEFDRALASLRNHVEHHVAGEERDLFAAAARLGHGHLTWLGREMEQRKRQLVESPAQKALRGMKKLARKVA